MARPVTTAVTAAPRRIASDPRLAATPGASSPARARRAHAPSAHDAAQALELHRARFAFAAVPLQVRRKRRRPDVVEQAFLDGRARLASNDAGPAAGSRPFAKVRAAFALTRSHSVVRLPSRPLARHPASAPMVAIGAQRDGFAMHDARSGGTPARGIANNPARRPRRQSPSSASATRARRFFVANGRRLDSSSPMAHASWPRPRPRSRLPGCRQRGGPSTPLASATRE